MKHNLTFYLVLGLSNLISGMSTISLVDATALVRELPEYFTSRYTVLRLAKQEQIPHYAMPGSRPGQKRYMFRPRDVKAAMEKFHRKGR